MKREYHAISQPLNTVEDLNLQVLFRQTSHSKLFT